MRRGRGGGEIIYLDKCIKGKKRCYRERKRKGGSLYDLVFLLLMGIWRGGKKGKRGKGL